MKTPFLAIAKLLMEDVTKYKTILDHDTLLGYSSVILFSDINITEVKWIILT